MTLLIGRNFNYFCLTADKSGSSILSDDCKETLFLAKSLLDALVRVISDGSVTFQVLLLLQRHKETFLELLMTSAAEVKDAELSLAHRLEEIQEFFVVKENLGTFIGMCDVIQPGKRFFRHRFFPFVLFTTCLYSTLASRRSFFDLF